MDDRPVLDELRLEHTVILDVVRRLETSVSADRDLPLGFVREAIGFLRTFADENHHGKEEDALFPVMRGDEFLASLAEQLGDEHDEARRLVAGIEKALDGGDARSVSRLVGDYASLIRDHIRREDEMIFNAAEFALSPGDREALRRGFRVIEAQALGEGGVAALLERLKRAEESP